MNISLSLHANPTHVTIRGVACSTRNLVLLTQLYTSYYLCLIDTVLGLVYIKAHGK
jgi:hypothetical protein